jgi:hypothetical protein
VQHALPSDSRRGSKSTSIAGERFPAKGGEGAPIILAGFHA